MKFVLRYRPEVVADLDTGRRSLPRVFRTLDDFGLPFPVICTTQDMLEEYGDDPTN